MQLFIHCGFPKTGTTALQRWFSNNEHRLSHLGIAYPAEFRDDEGIAHHLLNKLANQGFDYIANNVVRTADVQQCSKLILSTEGLSNILGTEDGKGLSFFENLSNLLNTADLRTSFLFTLRRIDGYLRSIIIQNILYHGLCDTPSVYASHTLSTLERAYATIAELLQLGSIKLFEYSRDINQVIVEYILECPLSALHGGDSIGFEHASPSQHVVQFFTWLNYARVKISPDFHSYIRFHHSSQEILSHYNSLISESVMTMDLFAARWEPSAELLDSSLRFFNMAWAKSLSYESRADPLTQGGEYLILRKHLGCDVPVLIARELVGLDYIHYRALESSSAALYGEALDILIDQGSREYGQDFSAQVDQSMVRV